MPKTMLVVHGWLMTQAAPVTTDDAMQALSLSRGSAHTMLQSLVDWKLAHAFKPLGTRQVRFMAEDDPYAMLIAIVRVRKTRELEPLVALSEWNDRMEPAVASEGRSEFHDRLARITERASRLNEVLDRSVREDEGWWWRWLLSPLRTK